MGRRSFDPGRGSPIDIGCNSRVCLQRTPALGTPGSLVRARCQYMPNAGGPHPTVARSFGREHYLPRGSCIAWFSGIMQGGSSGFSWGDGRGSWPWLPAKLITWLSGGKGSLPCLPSAWLFNCLTDCLKVPVWLPACRSARPPAYFAPQPNRAFLAALQGLRRNPTSQARRARRNLHILLSLSLYIYIYIYIYMQAAMQAGGPAARCVV